MSFFQNFSYIYMAVVAHWRLIIRYCGCNHYSTNW